MPPLKGIEQAQFGGVDSRSNPINMPTQRFLLCRNWIPRPDGHLDLRDGYRKLVAAQMPLGGPAYSLMYYQMAVPGTEPTFPNSPDGIPNGTKCALWWQKASLAASPPPAVPYLMRLDTMAIISPIVDGLPIAAADKWHYALGKDGFLYMHNGTDAKFFDGCKLRDIGLPALDAEQIADVSVLPGFGAPSVAGVTAATVTPANTGGATLSPGLYEFYYTFFQKSTNTLATATVPLTAAFVSLTAPDNSFTIANLPVIPNSNIVGLISRNYQPAGGAFNPGASFYNVGAINASDPLRAMTGVMAPVGGGSSAVQIGTFSPTTIAVGDIVALNNAGGTAWPSSGPFTVTAIDTVGGNWFQFDAASPTEAALYSSGSVEVDKLLAIPYGSNAPTGPIISDDVLYWQGKAVSNTGQMQLDYTDLIQSDLLPASAIGGAQPGYQFYASIYNPITGHVGNRVPIGPRLDNASDCEVIISNLPNITMLGLGASMKKAQPQVRYGYGSKNILWGARGPRNGEDPIALPQTNPEWEILIGRTGDGGEVPYACIDANGNWITTVPAQTTITIAAQDIDGNSELPFANYPPPPFECFWREGDRMCGTVSVTIPGKQTQFQPFVYRSGSEQDATTGIFVGDPAQAWDPSAVETFPTAEGVIGGFMNMQESWVFSPNDCGVLSELSGEVSWSGPWNFGIAGPWAMDTGWKSLPFWVSHDKQLCTMLPNSDGPIPISTEYETALLFRIGDDYDSSGNYLGYKRATQVTFFRDPAKLVEVLRIKCVDANGNPFTIIHDFHLRDDSSPYGQGYEEDYAGELATDFQQAYMRDVTGHQRIWATAADGAIYQFYTGGLDGIAIDGTGGSTFVADAINLRYLGAERTAVKTLEWYGDENILWYITENMLNVIPDTNYWVDLTDEFRPVPGDAENAHFEADLQRPEMTHCYLWMQLTAHPQDLPSVAVPPVLATSSVPMALNVPPHLPLETYGRLYMATPVLGDSRGR